MAGRDIQPVNYGGENASLRARRIQFDITPDDDYDLGDADGANPDGYVTSAVWVEGAGQIDFHDAEGNECSIVVPAYTLISWVRMARVLESTSATGLRGYP